MMEKIWRKNFEVSRCSFLLFDEVADVIYKDEDLTAGKKAISEAIFIMQGQDNTGSYFIKEELRELVDLTLKAISDQPNKINHLHRIAEDGTTKLIALSREIQTADLSKLPTKRLGAIYNNLYHLITLNHGTALPTTWFVDSDGEDLSNHLLNYVKKRIEANGLKLNFAEAFSVLTTPARFTIGQIETKESLAILQQIKKDPVARRIFMQKDWVKIENDLSRIKPALRKKIHAHHQKWLWTPYTYLGPVYDLNYYLQVWSGLLRQKTDITRLLSELKTVNRKTNTKRRELIDLLKIDAKYRRVFDLAADIVWLKAYRKDGMFCASFAADILYLEVGRRFNLSLNQVRYLTHQETSKLLLKNKLPPLAEINQRIKACVIHMKNGKVNILTGPSARKFLARQNFEKIKVTNIKELKGTPACPGKVSGTVKIINLPEEMGKMNVGDIMVSHTTFPALVPAMKKATAIVTDDGGLTCHAAIVARELKKPCVVGVKMATLVFKDGDKIEVDADNGVVTKIIDNK